MSIKSIIEDAEEITAPAPKKTTKPTKGNGHAGQTVPAKADNETDDVGDADAAQEAAEETERGEAESGARPPKQADILIGLAASAELFHTPDGTGYADIEHGGHRETWSIRSKAIKLWLSGLYFKAMNSAPSAEALQSALNVLAAKAHFDSPERAVYVRVGALDGKIYIDLGDAEWRSVEIDVTGWRVVSEPPVRFRRASGMLPLPEPVKGGSIEKLRPFLNVKREADFVLIVAWIFAALRPVGPYPVMVLSGEQGSAKSTFARILRSLIDPNSVPLRALPRENRDMFIAASNGHLLNFDNVSGLPEWISDTLCRLATGGGFAVRALYTDQDEVLFDACRPTVLNGIEDIVTKPDLADRAIFLPLEPIADDKRRPEQELWDAFKIAQPAIQGAVFDAVARGLKQLPTTHLKTMPRMADFALWAAACERAPGTFMQAYGDNRDEAIELVIEADAVATTVRALMADRTKWEGTAADLLEVLSNLAGDRAARSKSWPISPRALAGRIRRAATFLRKIGIEFSFTKKGRNRDRVVCITKTEKAPELPSAQSAPSAIEEKPTPVNDLADSDMRTVLRTVADDHGAIVRTTVRSKSLNTKAADDADDADDLLPPLSGETPSCAQGSGETGQLFARVTIREIRHPAIKSGPDDNLDDFASL